MGSILTRPSDTLTPDNLLIGMPFVEFAPKLSSGGFGSFRDLGIIRSAALQKTLEVITLRDSRSGISEKIRELVRQFDASLVVTTHKFDKQNLQLFLAAKSVTDINAGTATATNETVTLTDDPKNWADLANSLVQTFTSLEPAQISDEAVGTGDGSTLTFNLDFKVNATGDVSSLTVGGTERSGDLVSGTSPSAGQIGLVTGTGSDSGKLTFPSGEAPADGDAIVATYTPSFSLTENTDFSVDYPGGRIRRIDIASDKLKDNQPVDATYDYETFDGAKLPPFSQFVFEGKARVRLLTDVGINLDWEIPVVNLRVTDTEFAFSEDDFATGELALQLIKDSTQPDKPYGEAKVYDENAA